MTTDTSMSASENGHTPGVRHDKFVVGDSVVWADEWYATMTGGRERLGSGPFEIIEVFDREYDPPYDDDGQSNWSSMGHTQHVLVAGSDIMWSGAYFVKTEGGAS